MEKEVQGKLKAAGHFEITVTKPNGEIRKQFAEWKWAHKLRLSGHALPNLHGLTGRMVSTVGVDNLVTNAGFAQIVLRMGGTSSAVADYIGNGTGTTAANAADTTLETEISDSGLTRAQGTISQVTTTVTGDTHQVAKTFTVSGTKAITEVGLLNASSNGTLVGRNVFSAVNVVSGDSYAVTYKIKQA